MHTPTILVTMITFLLTLITPVITAPASIPLFSRDNACTACLSMIQTAVQIPQILDPYNCDTHKTQVMHDQVCSTLQSTPLFNFCETYVDAWSTQGLYQFLQKNSTDPQIVCSQFKAC